MSEPDDRFVGGTGDANRSEWDKKGELEDLAVVGH
jgi:hypothetical protein